MNLFPFLMDRYITPAFHAGLVDTLFAAPPPNPFRAHDRASAERPSPSNAMRRRSLLILEDNPSTRILLVYMLKGIYDVKAAASFDEALALIHDHAFDGLVLDINLCEDRTGIDLLHSARQIPTYAHVPAVACTAYTSFGDRERLLESGFDRYVAKPFTKEQLRNALALLFDHADRKAGSDFKA